MIPLVATEDGNGNAFLGMRRPSSIDVIVLAANTFKSVVVPDGANHVLFAGSGNFFVKYASTSYTSSVYSKGTISTAGVCSRDGAEMNPDLRTLTGVTGLGMMMPSAGYVSMSWFG